MHETTRPVEADGRSFPAGSYLVLTRQMFGGYANTLLERQRYPNLREYPGGPPKAPYDVTAHTLPLLFGLDIAAVRADDPPAGPPVAPMPEPRYTVAGPEWHRDQAHGHLPELQRVDGRGLDPVGVRCQPDAFTTIHDRDVRAGNLARPIRCHHAARVKAPINCNADWGARTPIRCVAAWATRARRHSRRSWRPVVIFWRSTTRVDYAIEALGLPVRDVLAGVRNTDFYAPGSLFAVEVDTAHPTARTFTAPVPAVWFEGSPAFEVTDASQATVVARYPSAGDPLLSGWLLGGARLNGKAAMVDVSLGQGHVVLYGFRPQYRAQTNATWPLIWGGVLR